MEGSGGAHEIHRLVLVHGRERARELVDPKAPPACRYRCRGNGGRNSADRHFLYGILPDGVAA